MAQELDKDPLFVALTRPPLPFGVSTMWLGLNGAGNLIGLILDPSLKYVFMAVGMHLLGYFLYSKEPLFLELFKTKLSKCGYRFNTVFVHGKNSYDPF